MPYESKSRKDMEMQTLFQEERLYQHSKMVSQVSGAIARSAGYTSKEVALIQDAAWLHDIGKNTIPISILQKPTLLSCEEFAIVKAHTQEGFAYLIQQTKKYLTAAIVALQHHEKPTGNGYAAVTHIHSYARLVAIADVFDALFSARSYKDRWSLDDVIGYMRSNVHKEFDAAYLDAFLRALDEILELYKQELLSEK